jgi:cytochrome P450
MYLTRVKQEPLTLEEIKANANVLVIAGSETTATGLAAVTFFLCTHPQVLAKLQAEVRQSFQSADEIDFTSVLPLKYLDAVINESLRMMPPAPGHTTRVINENGDALDGHYLPPGVSCPDSLLLV